MTFSTKSRGEVLNGLLAVGCHLRKAFHHQLIPLVSSELKESIDSWITSMNALPYGSTRVIRSNFVPKFDFTRVLFARHSATMEQTALPAPVKIGACLDFRKGWKFQISHQYSSK